MGVVIDYTSGFFEAAPTGETVGSISGNATLDLTSGNVFSHTPTANTTFAFSNPPASGTGYDFTLKVTGANVASGYDIANASYDSVSFSVNSQDTTPYRVIFKPDGTKMYVVGLQNDDLYQYSLSTAWDLSTASYDSVSFSFNGQDNIPISAVFNDDGTKLFLVGGTADIVYQYSLSTAYDISTLSYDSVTFNPSAQTTSPSGIEFNTDGTIMYLLHAGVTPAIYQYSLSTAFDISTASYASKSFDPSSQGTQARDIRFNSDGTKLFYISDDASDNVYQYSLSTAFDISTASYDSVSFSVNSQASLPVGIFFKSDGTKMYVVDNTTDTVYQYSTSGTAAAATIAYPSSVKWAGGTAPTAPANGETDVYSFFTTDGGTNYYGFQAGDALA